MVPGLRVLGANSLVGNALLRRLAGAERHVIAYSRTPRAGGSHDGAEWRATGALAREVRADGTAPDWISLVPIRVLPDHLPAIQAIGARRLAALSSTSRFSKLASSDDGERLAAQRIADCETRLEEWAERTGTEWVVLRPTLIYGNGEDRNICEIARLIARFGFFPLIGEAAGRRQPVHADDVAAACLAALEAPAARNRAYNLSGAEILAYRAMVARVFAALGRRERFLKCPIFAFRTALAMLRLVPRYGTWSLAMVERMNQDLVFDHADAMRDLAFKPRPFRLNAGDLPK